MTRTSQEQLKNKFSLVYEYNKQSPLFVRVAESEIDKNNFHSAIEILNKGLQNYPDYPTAHIMLGKAFIRLGEYEKAEEAFVKGCDLINSKKTLAYYINELEKIKRVDSLYLTSKRIPFIPENFERAIYNEEEEHQDAIEVTDDEILMETGNLDILEEDKIEIPESGEEEQNPAAQAEPIEERLEDLAKEISSIRIILNDAEPASESLRNIPKQEEEIVTETLAKIFMSQGKFKEAIDVYMKLSTKFPEKETYYIEVIKKIESQIGDW